MSTTKIALIEMTDREKNDHLYLCMAREVASRELFDVLTYWKDDEEAQSLLDGMITYDRLWSCYNHIKEYLISHEYYGVIDDLDTFKDLCLRVAKLERIACNYPLERELEAA